MSIEKEGKKDKMNKERKLRKINSLMLEILELNNEQFYKVWDLMVDERIKRERMYKKRERK